jgi:antitoxin VapB
MSEQEEKHRRIREFLAQQKLDALLLQRASSFAWATSGASSYINTASTTGAASLLVTPSERYLIADNIETPRLEQEEGLAAQGWQSRTHRWYEGGTAIEDLTQGLTLGSDMPYPGARDVSGELARLRARLTPQEGEKFRALGRACGEAMNSAIRAVRPGMTEYEIAGLLAREAESRGAQPIVNLVATDERVFSYRHPLPTEKKLQRYAMLVLCGRRWGLVCSITRLVHFGPLPHELRRKEQAVAQIDATFIHATRPGRTIGEVIERAIRTYEEVGYPDEWNLHHQGGPAGYEPREYLATPGSAEDVFAGQAFAWNPSITGTKSEDTILVSEDGYEVITAIKGWPMTVVSVGGNSIERPAILEVND